MTTTLNEIKHTYGVFTIDSAETTTLHKVEPRCCGLFSKYSVHPLDSKREERVSKIAALITEEQIGSCEGQVCVAYEYLKNKISPEINLEIVSLKNYDHFVLLIGRDPGTDLHDPATWNKDAAVCEPWAGTVYPAAEFEQQMKFLVKTKSIYKISSAADFRCVNIHANKLINTLQHKGYHY